MSSENKNVLFIGGDRRNAYLYESLRRKDNIDLHAFGLAVADKSLGDIEKAIGEADVVILPMPSVKNGMVPLLSTETAYPLDTILQNMREGAALVGGFLGGTPSKAGIKVINLLTSERFQQANAWPTAEGAIRVALERTERTLKGSRCAVLGYGRIGKDLVKLLRSFGAEVIATARRKEQLEDISALGVIAGPTNDLVEACSDCNFIFNTIPYVLLDEEKLRTLRRDVVIIDLASSPFGVDFNAATRMKLDAQTYQSLPGRMFPRTAADIIYSCIKDLFI
jgi:dipicolinate synthase subunit A